MHDAFGLPNGYEVTPEAKGWLTPIAQDLAKLYQTEGRALSSLDFMLLVEKTFGARLLAEVCLPHQLTMGSCLLIAAAVARDTPLDT